MPDLTERTAALVETAGYGPQDPLVVGVQQDGAAPVVVARGRTSDGDPLTAGSVLYTASLAKQVTAACAALLVRGGRLDLESTLGLWMPELPPWADTIRVRHLLSHTSGLPEPQEFEEIERAGLDRTTDGVLEGLVRADHLRSAPGSEHRYSNAGYVCLGVVVGRAAGRPLADVAREQVLAPLGMASSGYWSGPAPHPPGAAPLDPPHPAALSVGDGGLWSTAGDLLRWNLALDRDELGVSALMQTPGRLDDGTPLDYAWDLGVREHAGRPVYRHGGRWAGLTAQLVRVAGDGTGVVVLALDDDDDRTSALADALLDELTA